MIINNETLYEVRKELWAAGLKYGKICIELGLSEELAIEKYFAAKDTPTMDKDIKDIAKCSIAFAYC